MSRRETLDSATGALVMETFHKLQKRGKTIVLITHDPGIAAEADRAVTIRDGRIHDGAYIPHAPRTCAAPWITCP